MRRREFLILRRRVPSEVSHVHHKRFIDRERTLIYATLLIMLVISAPAAAQNLVLEPIAEGLTAPLHLEEPPTAADENSSSSRMASSRCLARTPTGTRAVPRFAVTHANAGAELRGARPTGVCPSSSVRPQRPRLCDVLGAVASWRPQRWNRTRRVSAFTADPGNPAKIDAASERVVLEIDWPSRKHNGGGLAFGRDGFLYIGLGDGGISHGIGKKVLWEAFDVPAQALIFDGLAQDTDSLFGKILRIDIDRGFPGSGIPRDNPFAAGAGKKGIWAWGFRSVQCLRSP